MKIRLFLAAFAATALLVTSLQAEEPALKCPLSGKPASTDHSVEFNGGKVAFCCPNCPKAFESTKDKFAAKANLQLVQTKQLKQVACPLTGRPAAADKTVEVEGVEVGVCCAGCLGKVKKAEGDELISLLFKDTTKGFKPASE